MREGDRCRPRRRPATEDAAARREAKRTRILISATNGPGHGRDCALFLDFDGTLVEIAATPDAVVVDPALPGILAALRRRLGGALAIATGRPMSAIDGFLPDLGLDGCGLHGLERRIAGESLPVGDLPDIAPAIADLRARLAGHPGIVIEDKRIGVAAHWRTAPAAEADIRSAIDDLAKTLGPGFRIQDGKALLEIVPASSGKGGGIRALMEHPPYRGRVPVFVGDDRTDEHGFEAVAEHGGITVKVGEGPTTASHRIASPAAVRAWLAAWAEGEPPLDGAPWDKAPSAIKRNHSSPRPVERSGRGSVT